MVESLYGPKINPQMKSSEKGYFPSSFTHHRKVSGEPLSLRTIAEIDDDSEVARITDLSICSFSNPPTGPDHTPKPRAISLPLPTVYRDGSYLRINVSGRFNYERTRTRRFSEPAVAWTSKCNTAIVLDINHKRIHKPRVSEPRGSVSFELQKRRHSDPLLYTATRIQPDVTNLTNTLINHRGLSVFTYTATTENIPEQQTRETSSPDPAAVATQTRRRKSSLVPIPFGVKKSTTRKQKPASKRRYSFPLSKSEEEMASNLQGLEKYDEKRQDIGSNSDLMSSILPFGFTPVDDKKEILTTKEDYSSAENNNNCEKIITQWMKFFG